MLINQFPRIQRSFNIEMIKFPVLFRYISSVLYSVHKHDEVSSMDKDSWMQAVRDHRTRLNTLLKGNTHLDSAHPIYNFIFTYYFSLNKNKLLKWSPGMDTYLEDAILGDMNILAEASKFGQPLIAGPRNGYCWNKSTTKLSNEKLSSIEFVYSMIKSIDSRPPSFCCFGLHEWAMLYQVGDSIKNDNEISDKIQKFQGLPLRLSLNEVRDIVEKSSLRCTHYDAFRFFTPPAKQLNRIVDPAPSRKQAIALDQPGCIHVQMDLFKWAFKIFPLIPSSLLMDTLEVAIKAREIDLRASPYDLFAYKPDSCYLNNSNLVTKDESKETLEVNVETCYEHDFIRSPINIETAAGRKEYQHLQLELYHFSDPVRKRLIKYYEKVLQQHTTVQI